MHHVSSRFMYTHAVAVEYVSKHCAYSDVSSVTPCTFLQATIAIDSNDYNMTNYPHYG